MQFKTGFKKVFIGFAVIITFTILNGLISLITTDKNRQDIDYINNTLYTYVSKLNEFDLLLTRTKGLITSWVYIQVNDTDKNRLRQIHQTDYPRLKKELLEYAQAVESQANQDSLKIILEKTDALILAQGEIMGTLVVTDDYKDIIKLFSSEETVHEVILPQINEVENLLNRFVSRNVEQANIRKIKMLAAFDRSFLTVIITGAALLCVIVLVSVYIHRNISVPVFEMRENILQLGRGELPKTYVGNSDDIVQQMVDALNSLTKNFANTALVAEEIGKGNFDVQFKPLSDADVLGNALVEMKSRLKEYAEEMEEKVRERTAKLHQAYLEIETHNKNIRASINYAKRIQDAILPHHTIIQKAFPDSFVYFRPRDIVSGDFYFYTQVNTKSGLKQIISAVDCTGHGVPGAFMSMIGNELLHQIIRIDLTTSPEEILYRLHLGIRGTLKQDQTENRDGMDLTICVIDPKTKKLEFAGAKNPLIYVQNQEVYKIKGDKYPIGGKDLDEIRQYTKHEIIGDGNTWFYIYSDGYQDQFGGRHKRKFMAKRFRNLLLKIHTESAEKQKDMLNITLESWMQSERQIDDILVVGFRL